MLRTADETLVNYYADRYEELAALYSRSPQTVRYAKRCFDAALECR
jgi:hypothetical protein